MKTTELFVDQVIIGVLVVITLLALSPLSLPDLDTIDVSKAAALIIVGYLAGILYDRFADTLLQDLERHHRLQVALKRRKKSELPSDTNDRRELFDITRYRTVVIQNSDASEYSDYLRSRMRLTRSLSTLVPAMSLAVVAHLIKEKCHRFADCSAWNTPPLSREAMLQDAAQWQWLGLVMAAYALVFLAGGAKHRMARTAVRPNWRCLLGSRPPSTRVTGAALDRYRSLLRYDDDNRLSAWRQIWAHLVIDPLLCMAAVGLLAAAGAMAVLYGQSHLAAVPVAGLAVMLLANWAWWRIHRTFLNFIENFATAPPEAA